MDQSPIDKLDPDAHAKLGVFPPVWPENGQSGRMANGSQNQIPGLIERRTMNLTAEQVEGIKNELKRFGGDLNLSDEQRAKPHERLASAAEKLHE